MEEISRIEAEYVEAISSVLVYIQSHLDAKLTPSRLAGVAGFSQHHFHRIFRAVVGESIMDHIRRLRLERAAYNLKATHLSVSSIAFDTGFNSHEVFSRMFRVYFGITAKDFRRRKPTHLIPAQSGVHFNADGFSRLSRAVFPELLQSDSLCEAHSQCLCDFETDRDATLATITDFSTYIYPPGFRDAIKWQDTKEINMNDPLNDIDQEINELENEIEAAKLKLVEARKRRPKEPINDYILLDYDGNSVQLSQLFGDKSDLILVHNMGTGCSYCTMWADGFTGLVPHLSDRAAFVVCSPDKPEVQKRFAAKRNWNFKMVSAHGTDFLKDMGFWKEDGPTPMAWPGVSTFHKESSGEICRVAKTHFNPGDDFCAVWPFLDLLNDGPNNWEPKYYYEDKN